MTVEELFSEEIRTVLSEAAAELERLAGKRLLISGATGLIGSVLVRTVLAYNEKSEKKIALVLPVRDTQKAARMFHGCAESGAEIMCADVREPLCMDGKIDYIIHAAGETASRSFVENPVEVLGTTIGGTVHMLKLAVEKKAKGFVYLSTMEVYGAPEDGVRITETSGAVLDPMKPRSSYPEGKRAAESYVAAFAAEYGVPGVSLRLTQTFGPGVAYSDARMFQSFARASAEGRDIVLFTEGKTMRSYLYTADAAAAVFKVLFAGTPGEAYNCANEATYCSVRQMAEMIAARSEKGCSVRVEPRDTSEMGFAPVLYMDLDTGKLRGIGWSPRFGLDMMLDRLMQAAKQNASV